MMHLDFLALWVQSIQKFLDNRGVTISFSRSPGDRLNNSAWLTLAYGDREAQLIVWESGEAELSRMVSGSANHEHFDEINIETLGELLIKVLEVLE